MREDAHAAPDRHLAFDHGGAVDRRFPAFESLCIGLKEVRQKIEKVPRIFHRLPEAVVRNGAILRVLRQSGERALISVIPFASVFA